MKYPAVIPVTLLFVWIGLFGASTGHAAMLMHAPAGDRYVERSETGPTILPNGRMITPQGPMFRVKPHPYGLTMSADGRYVVTVSSDDPQLSILDVADPSNPKISFIPEGGKTNEGVLDAAFMGLAIAPDNRTLYVSGGEDWSVMAFDLETKSRLWRLDCAHAADGVDCKFGYAGAMAMTRDGQILYIADQSNFRVVIVDPVQQKVIGSVAVGRYPFGLALSGDDTRLYVANVGIYEYAYHRDKEGKIATLDFPAFGVPSKEAEEGVEIGGITVPPLGDPNDLRGMSIWTLDVSHRDAVQVLDKSKTGHLVGEQLEDFPAVGGSSPNSVAVTDTHVYVSNGSNDSITVVNTKTGKRERDIDLIVSKEARKLRGMIPFGLALSSDQSTLFVAEAGINAVGVVRLSDRKVLGHIPTAWFPSKLAASKDGRLLYVSCAKGIGSGPSAGPRHAEGDPTGIGALMRGYIHVLTLPESEAQYETLTRQVVENNVQMYPEKQDPRRKGHPVPPHKGAWKSPIKHVIYVTKENRTYDEVFGALPGGKGDPEICRLGKPVEVSSKDGTRKVQDVVLMPNHIALAKRFAINDNFYCDSDHSVDGHRWLVGTYPNEFMEARIGENAKGEGPGNFSFIGSSGAIYPEDYNEGGAIWEHFDRNGLRFRNYGLGFEFKPQDEEQQYRYTGIKLPINYPMPQALFENTSREFATYNTSVPDQFRIDMFEKEFNERWLNGKEPFPDVITMMLPNDHGSGERPDDGYPFWGSYMSDNDLALGRLVELISHSPFWKETAIFVTEDDAQGYVDTVDAHRSICMVISPYAQAGYISHTHSSIASILKTIFLIHGLPPLNQYDGFSSDLHDMFQAEPANLAPYKAVPVHPEIFDPQKALDPFDAKFNWQAFANDVPVDDQDYLDTDEYGNSGTQDHAPRKN